MQLPIVDSLKRSHRFRCDSCTDRWECEHSVSWKSESVSKWSVRLWYAKDIRRIYGRIIRGCKPLWQHCSTGSKPLSPLLQLKSWWSSKRSERLPKWRSEANVHWWTLRFQGWYQTWLLSDSLGFRFSLIQYFCVGCWSEAFDGGSRERIRIIRI